MPLVLSSHDVDSIVEAVVACADAGDFDHAWASSTPLREGQGQQPYAAFALLHLVDRRAFDTPRCIDVVRSVFDAHARDDDMLAALGCALEAAHDLRFLNAAPPSDPVFRDVAERLRERAAAARGTDAESTLLSGLATAARLLGRAWDRDAESAYRRLIELRPKLWQSHYDLALFFKVRGRFAEGLAANQRAAALGGDDECVRWNLGICATGAREGAAALAVWKDLGQHVELGRFGLPEGEYPAVKVRLAAHPLAARGIDYDGPGIEETIWIERLSPCHGIVRSALFQDLGVDYGDVVLFDGAPVMHQTHGERQVPVFPHLVTLQRSGYRTWPFVGTQPRAGGIGDLSSRLPDDAVLYSHTEQLVLLCAQCSEGQSAHHAGHRQAEHHVVRGKLCAPPTVAPADLRAALDAAIAATAGVRVFVPALSQLLGDDARAEVEARRVRMIEGQ
jgi:hypothetical protein